MKKKYLLTCLLLSYLTANGQVTPDTLEKKEVVELETIVIKENAFVTPLSHHTRNIVLYTKADIEKLPVRTLNELLAYIGGVDLRQRGPFGTQADVSIDGGSFEQTMVLLNGVKLMDSQTAHNMLNIPVPLEAIARIEVLKGPAARKYGINSMTGAINIITIENSTSSIAINTYVGSSFQQKEAGDGSGIYGGGGAQLTANYSNSKQHHLVTLSKDMYNGQRYNTAQDNTRLFYQGKYHINTDHHLQAMASYVANDFGANGYYAAPGDKESREIVNTALFSLSSQHTWKNFTLVPRVSNRYNEDDYRYFKHNLAVARSKHYSNALMAEVHGALQTRIGKFGIGWESRFEHINSSNIGQHQRDNHGFFAEYKNVFKNKWVTEVGAYVNYNQAFGWQVYPGFDLGYLFKSGFKVAINAAASQRIPSFTDLYLNQPTNVGNPNLKSENAWQYEANVQYNRRRIQASASVFYRDIDQFIDWVRDSLGMPYSPINLGRNQLIGANFRIKQSFLIKDKHRIGYTASYNYLQPSTREITALSKYVLESLRHQVILGINYGIGGFDIAINGRFIERELNDPYVLLDLRCSYRINNLLIYTDVSNMLNTVYKEAGAVPMPPRWFTLAVRYKFDYLKKK